MAFQASHPLTAVRRDHAVQFYQDPEFLARSVAGFLGEGFAAGEPAVVVATRDNRAAIADYLSDCEFDPDALERDGRYVALDAAEALSTFTVRGKPDPAAFAAQAGSLIDDVLHRNGASRIRAFGEMVDLLWRDGYHEGTLALESSWDAFALTRPIALICGYRLESFCQPGHHDHFERVCAQHSRVLPAETFASELDEDGRLRAVARMQRQAGTLALQEARGRVLQTALELAQSQDQEAQRLLGQVLRVRDELLDLSGEDLIAPLHALAMQLRSIVRASEQGRPLLDADWLRYRLGHAGEDIRRVTSLLEGLLDVARLRTGRQQLELQPGCLATLLRQIVQDFRRQSRGCRVELALDEASGHWDARRLSCLLQTLLEQAAGEDANGFVRVAMETLPSFVTIALEAGTRRDAPAQPQDPTGTRLGWWMARQLAGIMGGNLATGRPGGGTAFFLTLPRIP